MQYYLAFYQLKNYYHYTIITYQWLSFNNLSPLHKHPHYHVKLISNILVRN